MVMVMNLGNDNLDRSHCARGGNGDYKTLMTKFDDKDNIFALVALLQKTDKPFHDDIFANYSVMIIEGLSTWFLVLMCKLFSSFCSLNYYITHRQL